MAYFREHGLVEYALSGLECYFLKKNDIFKTLDDILLAVGPNSYAFSVHRPALQKRQEIF